METRGRETNMSRPCPKRERSAYLAGRLGSEADLRVRTHLEHCDTCRESLRPCSSSRRAQHCPKKSRNFDGSEWRRHSVGWPNRRPARSIPSTCSTRHRFLPLRRSRARRQRPLHRGALRGVRFCNSNNATACRVPPRVKRQCLLQSLDASARSARITLPATRSSAGARRPPLGRCFDGRAHSTPRWHRRGPRASDRNHGTLYARTSSV